MDPTAALERHPWNRGFQWRPPRGPFRRIAPACASHFDRHGWALLPDAVDATTLRELQEDIDPLEREVDRMLRGLPDQRAFIADARSLTFTINVASRVPRLRRFVSGPLFQDLVHDLIGPDGLLFWDQAVYKKSEEPRHFPWHQDNGYGFIEPQAYLTCWIALTDADETNGCPRVLSGGHRNGTLAHRTTPQGFELPLAPSLGTPVPVSAGSILLLSSLTPHTTGPSHQAAPRKAYIVQFAPAAAAYLRGDPEAGPPTHRETVGSLPAERQWPVLVAGSAPLAPLPSDPASNGR